MDIIVSLFALFCFFTAIIFPWINNNRINKLQQEIFYLRNKIKELSNSSHKPETNEEPKIQLSHKTENIDEPKIEQKQSHTSLNQFSLKQKQSALKFIQNPVLTPNPQPKVSFEEKFGAQMPVWIGGIALALAGFFLVKYSIDNNLLSPTVRVILGGLLGASLLYSASLIHKKPDFSNGVRIGQSLCGAGIAVLYVSIFAATNLYHLIPNFFGSVGMACVTAVAVTLSLRHGMPIALLGMVGGFLTPALIRSNDPSAPLLFMYLYFIVAGLMYVIKREKWWILSIPILLISFLWVFLWLFVGGAFSSEDSLCLGLFLIAISATIVMTSKEAYQAEIQQSFHINSALNYITLGGAIILMGIISSESGFGLIDWSLFGFLAIGGIVLAYFEDRLYRFVPWVSMLVNAVMLMMWQATNINSFVLVLIIFGIIYTASGYFLMWRSRLPLLWAGLAGSTAIIFYLIAYFKLHDMNVSLVPLLWGGIALSLASTAVYGLKKIHHHFYSYRDYDYLMALFSVVATAFISISLSIEVTKEFLPLAFVAQILAISWINSRISIKALPILTIILACIFAILISPKIALVIELVLNSINGIQLLHAIPTIESSIFQLGIPSVLFIGSSYFLRLKKENELVHSFEVIGISLIALMGYYVTRNILQPNTNQYLFEILSLFERGIVTNLFFIYGLSCLLIGRYFDRIAFSYYGIVLAILALSRIVYFDLFIHNPLWTDEKIGGLVILNSLLLPFGLPLIWLWIARKEFRLINSEKWKVDINIQDITKYFNLLLLVLSFVLISMNIRYYFNAPYLNADSLTNAELYSYSVVWLVLGIGLLFAGVLQKDKMLRHASLGVMILTIAKVFLYDASELEGLYRVFSFFGLGICLLGLSWFYSHFVFNQNQIDKKDIS